MGRPKPKPDDILYRTVDLRANQNGTGFAGYASTFWAADSYWTTIAPKAFRKTLGDRAGRWPILWQHDPYTPIGKPNEAKEDKTGLWIDAAITDATSAGRDAMALLRDDVPLGLSIGFQTLRGRDGTEDDPIDMSQLANNKLQKTDIYVIEEVRLWEVSVVTFPANEAATINDVRAANEAAFLSSLLDELRNGSLPEGDDRVPLLRALVAAFHDAEPEPDPSTPLVAGAARRRTIDITLALATAQGWIGATA